MPSYFKISCPVNTQCLLGEGPVWHEGSNTLFWVDILERKIFSYNLTTGDVNWWQTQEYVGFIILNPKGEILAGYKSGLHEIVLLENHVVRSQRIDTIDEKDSSVRFNDGMIDRNGDIWACSMDMNNARDLGKYFYYDDDLVQRIVLENYTVANGPALNNNRDKLYTVETVGNHHRVKGIYRYTITGKGRVANEELLVPWPHNSYPDGVFTDGFDNVWVGEFGGNVLRSFTADGKLKLEIPLPAWNVTKGVFCTTGEYRLFVTSARFGCSDATLQRYPQTGGILLIEGLI